MLDADGDGGGDGAELRRSRVIIGEARGAVAAPRSPAAHTAPAVLAPGGRLPLPPEVAARVVQSDVLCPVCRRQRLATLDTLIRCRGCGLSLNTSRGLGLDSLQESLAGAYGLHRERCPAEPAFAVRDLFGIRALYLECAACKDVQVVV
jgi:hypothetical protein